MSADRRRAKGGRPEVWLLRLAETWLLVCVVFLVANLVVSSLLSMRPKSDDRGPGPITRYGMPMLMTPGIYEGYSEDEVRDLLVETYLGVTLEPFTMFRETARTGRYVNVSDDGYRVIEGQRPWPPAQEVTNVFVFGGSTTFGYGIADSETVPSRLQAALLRRTSGTDLAVYHFGRGYYYSTQERILFEQLLTGGVDIDVALFIDGANEKDSADVPSLFYELVEARHQAARRLDPWESAKAAVARSPLGRAAVRVKRRLRAEEPSVEAEPSEAEARMAGRGAFHRYMRNRELLHAAGEASGTQVIFVWQPVHWLDFDAAHHPFGGLDPESHFMQRYLYEDMRRYIADTQAPDMLDLSWLSRDAYRPLYVDQVHYNAYFSAQLAEHIAEWLAPRFRADRAEGHGPH